MRTFHWHRDGEEMGQSSSSGALVLPGFVALVDYSVGFLFQAKSANKSEATQAPMQK